MPVQLGPVSIPTDAPRSALRGASHPTRRLAVWVGVALVAVGAGLAASGPNGPGGAPRPGVESPVTPMDMSVGTANNSPLLVAEPADARFVVLAHRQDAPDFGCGLELSGDGGRSWTAATPVPVLPEGAEKCYAPEVAFDRHGVLYYLFVGLQGAGNLPMGAFLTTSADRGRTFSLPQPVLGPLNFAVRMAIDRAWGPNGRIHLVWLHATSDPHLGGFGAPPNPILAAHSDDGGKTFSEPVPVSDPERAMVVAPSLALGPDHTVHVAYYDLNGDARDYYGLEGPTWEDPWSVVLASARDGGGRFETGTAVDDAIGPPERVMLIFTMPPPALVAHGRRLCAAWTDAREGDADVMLRCSSDGGRQWSRAHRLNDDAIGNGHRQYLPRLAISPGGRIDAVFYDRRADLHNVDNDVSYTYSLDGGRSFAANLRLTEEASDSRIGQEYAGAAAEGQVEIGSRLGLLSFRHRMLAAWADTRNYPVATTNQDLFVREIAWPEPSGPSPARLGGAALAGVGLLTGLVAVLSGRRRRGVVSR